MSPPYTSTYKRLWKANISLVGKFQKSLMNLDSKYLLYFRTNTSSVLPTYIFGHLTPAVLKGTPFSKSSLNAYILFLTQHSWWISFLFTKYLLWWRKMILPHPSRRQDLQLALTMEIWAEVLCVTGRNHKGPFILHHILFSVCIVISYVSCRSCTGRLCARDNRVKAHPQ